MTADAKLSPKAAASLLPTEGSLIPEELQLATRNGGMPLEALRYDITPVGLHYQLKSASTASGQTLYCMKRPSARLPGAVGRWNGTRAQAITS
jgi:hypothetical protein